MGQVSDQEVSAARAKVCGAWQIRRKDDAEWTTIKLHRNIYAIVCISLQVRFQLALTHTQTLPSDLPACLSCKPLCLPASALHLSQPHAARTCSIGPSCWQAARRCGKLVGGEHDC